MKSNFIKSILSGFSKHFSRREFISGTGLAAFGGLAGCTKTQEPVSTQSDPHISIPTYESIGIRPLTNCMGAYTSLSGSLMLPEAKMAVIEASRRYVEMDELMEAVGRRLAELTGAEWGIISTGCAACCTGAAAACIAGTDPEKMMMLPDTRGMKNEVIVPAGHRNVYDRSIWMVGAKMVEVSTAEEMETAINERTAMIADRGDFYGRGKLSFEDMVAIGNKHGIPILIDAAAERPDVPNVYLEAGCDLVSYSGGKCLRGPQSSGLLLGRKDLCKAAFLNLSPHHSYGRPMKAGKEEIMGLLTAVEMWVNGRDHEAEWKEWERKLAYISDAISSIYSVKTWVVQPPMRSNVAPRLSISWDENTLKLKPLEAKKQLREGSPRIEMWAEGAGLATIKTPWTEGAKLQIMSYMMESGDEVPVSRRLQEILSKAVV